MLSSLLDFVPQINSSSLSVLRTARVLRPLRMVNRFQSEPICLYPLPTGASCYALRPRSSPTRAAPPGHHSHARQPCHRDHVPVLRFWHLWRPALARYRCHMAMIENCLRNSLFCAGSLRARCTTSADEAFAPHDQGRPYICSNESSGGHDNCSLQHSC